MGCTQSTPQTPYDYYMSLDPEIGKTPGANRLYSDAWKLVKNQFFLCDFSVSTHLSTGRYFLIINEIEKLALESRCSLLFDPTIRISFHQATGRQVEFNYTIQLFKKNKNNLYPSAAIIRLCQSLHRIWLFRGLAEEDVRAAALEQINYDIQEYMPDSDQRRLIRAEKIYEMFSKPYDHAHLPFPYYVCIKNYCDNIAGKPKLKIPRLINPLEQTRMISNPDPVTGSDCVVCLNAPRVSLITRPCNHMVFCAECAEQYRENDKPCPICRTPIVLIEQFYIS